jgi:hypothetical protein
MFDLEHPETDRGCFDCHIYNPETLNGLHLSHIFNVEKDYGACTFDTKFLTHTHRLTYALNKSRGHIATNSFNLLFVAILLF